MFENLSDLRGESGQNLGGNDVDLGRRYMRLE